MILSGICLNAIFKSIQEAHSKPVGTGQCAKTAEGW